MHFWGMLISKSLFIFHEHELYVCYENYCVTSIWNIGEYANFVSNLLEYLISAVSL